MRLHYRQVSLHDTEVDCGIAAFTSSEVNPASPNRHSECRLLSEERTAVRKDPQQILVLRNCAPARGLQSVWRMYKRVPVRLTDPLLFKTFFFLNVFGIIQRSQNAVHNFP